MLCLLTYFQVEAEYVRITTAAHVPRLFTQLDQYTDQLIKVFKKKGGVAGKKIRQTLAPATQVRYSVGSKILWLIRSFSNLNS